MRTRRVIFTTKVPYVFLCTLGITSSRRRSPYLLRDEEPSASFAALLRAESSLQKAALLTHVAVRALRLESFAVGTHLRKGYLAFYLLPLFL